MATGFVRQDYTQTRKEVSPPTPSEVHPPPPPALCVNQSHELYYVHLVIMQKALPFASTHFNSNELHPQHPLSYETEEDA